MTIPSTSACVPPGHGAHDTTRVGYEIRVKDQLDQCWWHWFDGWTVTNLKSGEAVLRNLSADQSALHGALNKIRDLNLTLLAVARIAKPDEQRDSDALEKGSR